LEIAVQLLIVAAQQREAATEHSFMETEKIPKIPGIYADTAIICCVKRLNTLVKGGMVGEIILIEHCWLFF
jgi:hypothetical protein